MSANFTDNKESSSSEADASGLLEAWAKRFGPALRRYFLKRVNSPAAADDLVQDVFLRLARRADLSTIESIEKYIFQTARSALAEQYRREKVRMSAAHDYFEDEQHGVTGITPETVLLHKEAVDELVAALYALPERTRDVYVLYHFDNLKQGEIAERLGISRRTVEREMSRANLAVLKRLERRL